MSRLSKQAEAYVRVMSLENALRLGPLDEETQLLRCEIVAEQEALMKVAMPAAFLREQARRAKKRG